MFSRTRANRIMIGAAGLFMVTALPACSFFTPVAEPTFSELTGVWGNGETRLTLKNDDTFTLEDAPTYTDLFRDEDWQSWTSETYDSAGEWRLCLTLFGYRAAKSTLSNRQENRFWNSE